MDLDLDSDQELFRATSRRFVSEVCPLATVRALGDAGVDVDDAYFSQAAELGWFGLLVPEALGGGSISGHGVFDAAIAAEERGRLLQPGPFVAMNVVAHAIVTGGSVDTRAQVLPALMAGERLAVWAVTNRVGEFDPAGGVEVTWSGYTGKVRGTKVLVHDAHRASWVLVSVADKGGVSQLLVAADRPGVEIIRRASLDLGRPLGEVVFDDVEVTRDMLLGEAGSATASVERQLDLASVLTCAESVGSMDVLFEMALDYAKARTAFGRPIGSFQAVKHLLADTSMSLEQSKAISAAATRAVDEQASDASELASIAKAFVAETGVDLAHNCWQVFGGIGYTWEHDLHLYLRRLTLDATLYGDETFHYERICRLNKLGAD
jgi:alkylation response protein AidB-like acyl-CoA dehydrogenase